MKITFLRSVLLTGCALALAAGAAAAASGRGLHAGAAQAEITPPLGFPMAGYFNERRATGVHDPLRARAVVLSQGPQTVALVFCDLIGIPLEVASAARAEASRLTGIPVSNILVAATHTHTGPLFQDVRHHLAGGAGMPEFRAQDDQAYADFLKSRIVDAIRAASANRTPATLGCGVAQQEGLSFNRRFHLKDGSVQFNPGRLNPNIVRPAGPIDPDLGLVMLRARSGREPIFLLSVFACHLDTVGGTLFSADYPHFFERGLEAITGNGAGRAQPPFVFAFGLGTCGDINHINVRAREQPTGWSMPELIGSALASNALESLPRLARSARPALAARSVTLTLPLQEITTNQLARARALLDRKPPGQVPFLEIVEAVKIVDLARRAGDAAPAADGAIRQSWPVEIQVFRLDADTAVVGLPGEIFVDLGLAIKRLSPFKRTMVLSLCNDRPAYVPTRKGFEEGSYETVNSRLRSGAGEVMVDAAAGLLAELSR